MQFLAWLNAPLATRLSHAVDGVHQVQLSNSRDEFLLALREQPVDVVVIDPSLATYDVRNPDASIALALLAAAPNASVIVYGYPTQRVVTELGTIARNHQALFVVRDARDELGQLRLALSVATALNPTIELLTRLESPLTRLPSPVARALALTLERPEDVHRVADVAFAAGKSERTLNRYLDNAGLHSAGYFVTAARLLYAYRLLQQPRTRVADVADRLGYASVNHFREAVRRVIDRSPRDLRTMAAAPFAERIARWLARGASAVSASSAGETFRHPAKSEAHA